MFESAIAAYEEASPSMLAEQPPTLPEEMHKYDLDWEITFSHLESRLSAMRDWRYSWWTYWSKLAEYILPRRYIWLCVANLMRRGNPINQAIIDGTAGLAKNICYTGMVDGLTPTTRQWFKYKPALKTVELDADGQEWCEDTEQKLYIILAGSNFYDTMAQVAEDEVVFGTAPIIAYEDSEHVVWFFNPCAGEYYLAVGARFTVDTLYREFTMTVSQIVDFFTLKACPQMIRSAWATAGGSLEKEFVVAHAIEPNFDLAKPGHGSSKVTVVRGGFTFREVYWLRGTKTEAPLSVRGFHKKPFAAFRWSKTANDAYGRSPGMDALGDIIQMQIETRRKAEALEKQVRPPMGADPSMKNEAASVNPGHITYTSTENGRKGFWSLYDVKIDLMAMIKDLEGIAQRIEKYFYNDVFLAISNMEGVQPRQNMEIAERKAEKMMRLGPIIGLWKTEAHAVLDRVVDIADRRKILKPKPKSLQGVELKFEFLDMVTLAQLGAETAAMEQCFETGGKLSLAAKAATLPDPLRIMNGDEAYRHYLDRMNFPAKAIYDMRTVARHDQARAQATQQKQAAAIPAATLPAVDAASTLAKIPAGGGNSILGQLMGGAGPPGAGPLPGS